MNVTRIWNKDDFRRGMYSYINLSVRTPLKRHNNFAGALVVGIVLFYHLTYLWRQTKIYYISTKVGQHVNVHGIVTEGTESISSNYLFSQENFSLNVFFQNWIQVSPSSWICINCHTRSALKGTGNRKKLIYKMTHRTRFERKETIRSSMNPHNLFRRLSSFYTAFLELRQVLFKSMTSPDEVTTFQRTNCLGWSSCFATSAEWCPLLRDSYTVFNDYDLTLLMNEFFSQNFRILNFSQSFAR